MLMRHASPSLLVGAAEIDFTPPPGLSLLGQMHERLATHARDPLMANAIAFRQGRETVVLVSVDIGMLDDAFVKRTQAELRVMESRSFSNAWINFVCC